jgi:hypothetical protein
MYSRIIQKKIVLTEVIAHIHFYRHEADNTAAALYDENVLKFN